MPCWRRFFINFGICMRIFASSVFGVFIEDITGRLTNDLRTPVSRVAQGP